MQNKIELNKKLIEGWVEAFLNPEVLDVYALSYEKSRKKSDEEKRKNKKYLKYYKKAEEEVALKISKKLKKLLLDGKISEKSSIEEVGKEVLSFLKSELRLTRLCKVIKNHNFSKTETKTKKKEDKKNNSKVENKKLSRKKPSQVKPKSPKEEEFFEEYGEYATYFDPSDGTEFRVVEYFPDSDEVRIFHYKKFVFNPEDYSWEMKENGREEVLKKEDFIKLAESHISDRENHQHELDLIEQELIEDFSENERKILKDLVGYVDYCYEELENFLNEEESSNSRDIRKKYLDRFWNVDLIEELETLGDKIDLKKQSKIIDYLKFKKQN